MEKIQIGTFVYLEKINPLSYSMHYGSCGL